MTIHHSTKTKAEKLGIMLTELDGTNGALTMRDDTPVGTVQAFWGQYNVYAFGIGAKPAMEQAEALQAIKERHPTCHIHNEPADPFLIRVWNDDRTAVLDREALLPVDALLVSHQNKPWMPTEVPTHGGEAHKAGFPITENPYEEGEGEHDSDDFIQWDADWEESADAADAEADEPDVGGSVVKSEYRIRYAEAGHPNHCGDWLANTLNALVLGKTETDLEKLETIFAENGVDTTKYKREGNGWQGRIRMTGRNLLARQVFIAGGKLKLPEGIHPDNLREMQAPGDWINAQRFKTPKKTEPAKSDADKNPPATEQDDAE